MKIACLITGAPRTFRYCVDSLKFYLTNHDVDFFLVYRDDNSDDETSGQLLDAYRPRFYKVTTATDTRELERDAGTSQMLTRMWHEVRVGRDLIAPVAHEYDLFMRVRYDTFFAPQFLETDVKERSCIIPRVYEYLGYNDMFCLAKWSEFFEYASTVDRLPQVVSRLGGTYSPELIVAESLRSAGIKADVREIHLGVHRPWYNSATPGEFSEIVMRHPRDLLIKYEQAARDPISAEKGAVALINKVRNDALIPIGSNDSFHWYGVEQDTRDNLLYRFFHNQAALWRSIPNYVSKFRFVVPFKVQAWPIEKLRVFFDGQHVPLEISRDAFGRYVIEGVIPIESKGRAPKSKISFLFNYIAIPALEGSNPKDNRALSMAVSDIKFI